VLAGAPQPNLVAISRNVGASVEIVDRYYLKRLTGELFAETMATSVV
jgi:hypothetical protein